MQSVLGWGDPQSGEQGLGRPTGGARKGFCSGGEDGRGGPGTGNGMRSGTAGSEHCTTEGGLVGTTARGMGPLTCQEQLDPRGMTDHGPEP